VSGLSRIGRIGTGWYHSCAVDRDQRARCWGLNQDGELGDGGMDATAKPVLVDGLPGSASSVPATQSPWLVRLGLALLSLAWQRVGYNRLKST
jgi:alpha-tubulin suppressor-like RCC1 family protein